MTPAHNTTKLLGEALQTTDATVTTLSYFVTKPGKCYLFSADVVALKSDFTAAAGYRRAATFRTAAAGTLTQVSTTYAPFSHEDTGGYDCEIVAGTVVLANATVPAIILRVTGAALTTVNWRADVEVNEVGFEAQYS